ncbi:cold shock domain-containing protein [Apilactobacillus apisilvae]|uniref:Cold shock domain-containing protein n=1 Tax=Apilactobacillus apisilvae TaxID=2923364 RepID=A0ABY4PIQ9_9LACO|nr:cold shock domain-containing protein [Apilactobacillus apisilvae]UQS85540.1 cold shock domain-containing protein [Apilactobacillus apisilvae]
MIKGKVNNFNPEHGFGFLKGQDKNKVFFHTSAVSNKKAADIKIGEAVEYQIAEGQKGQQAVKITFLEDNDSLKKD